MDPQQWERLCKIYGPLVYYWCRKAEVSATDAEDVGQDVFQTVAAKIGNFDGSSFRGWLFGITRNKIGDWLRQQQKRGHLQHVDFAQFIEPLQAAENSEMSAPNTAILRRMLDCLEAEFEPQTWRAFWLSTVEDRSTDAIALEIDMTPGAIRNAKYKVLRRLRQAFAGL